jgi:hypothetical protein
MDNGGSWFNRIQSIISAKNYYEYDDYQYNDIHNDYTSKEGNLKLLKWAKKHGFPI